MTNPYTIKLCFDVDQLAQSLRYEIYDPNGEFKFMESYGQLAGSYSFSHDDKTKVEVVATAKRSSKYPNPKVELISVNCAFVFALRPNSGGKKPYMSPFSERVATFGYSNEDWSWDDIYKTEEQKYIAVHLPAKDIHPVQALCGQWAASGYLSVTYKVGDGDETSRYFKFDPETSAGSGGNEPPVAGYE